MKIGRNELRSIIREAYRGAVNEEVDGPSLDLKSMAKMLESITQHIEMASSYMINGEVDIEEGCHEIESQVKSLYDIIDNLRLMASTSRGV